MIGQKQRTAILYGTTIFAAFLLILLFIVTFFGDQFHSLNVLSSELFTRARFTFPGVSVLFLPAGLFFAFAIGWIISQELFPKKRSDIQLDDDLATHAPSPDDEAGVSERLHSVHDTIQSMQTAYEQIQAFSANASHELRTPLTIMRGEIELALRSSKSRDEYQRVLGSLLEEIMRLSRILDDLLLIAKTEIGEKPLELQPVDLAELVGEIADEAEMHAEQNGITFHLGAVEPAVCMGEPLRLRRVVLNLVDNAVKYNRPHGSVTLSLVRDAQQAHVRVKDTGIGIPAEAIPRLFERFYRVHDAGAAGVKGTGLGLYLVHWIVRNHGGAIRVFSEPGVGSEFIVTLPVKS